MEHAAEVWWSGGRSECRKLEWTQMRVGRRLLRASQGSHGHAGKLPMGPMSIGAPYVNLRSPIAP